jgi:type VI secretion system protein VasI
MRVVTILGALFGCSSIAMANPCLSVENDLDRLACYDREAGRTPSSQSVDVPSGGQWSVRSETSAMTDRTDVFLSLDSEEIIDCGWNNGKKISLVIRCYDDKTSLYFDTGCHMTSSEYNDYGDIQYRIDSGSAKKVGGEESTNNRALGLWSGGQAIPMIKQMIGKSKMLVRMTPFGENSFAATFNIAGLDKAIEPLKKACGW